LKNCVLAVAYTHSVVRVAQRDEEEEKKKEKKSFQFRAKVIIIDVFWIFLEKNWFVIEKKRW